MIAVPLPSINNAKQFLTIRLLPPHQSLRKLLENSWRFIQSSTSLPCHLPKHTSIKHYHFDCNCGPAAIYQQRQTIPHHQAMASTSTLAKISRELVQTHPIKHTLTLAPPKVHINQTSPFECDCSAAAIHRQCQTIPHHQAITSTLILVKITWELVKIHPIKCEHSLTPPKTQINKK